MVESQETSKSFLRKSRVTKLFDVKEEASGFNFLLDSTGGYTLYLSFSFFTFGLHVS